MDNKDIISHKEQLLKIISEIKWDKFEQTPSFVANKQFILTTTKAIENSVPVMLEDTNNITTEMDNLYEENKDWSLLFAEASFFEEIESFCLTTSKVSYDNCHCIIGQYTML
jgi:hypothetical protein